MTSIKILGESRAMIAPLTQSADAEVKQVVDQAIQEVARVDGDRVLDQFEAEAIQRAVASAVPQGLGTYSARVPGGPATTGWSTAHHGTVPVAGRGARADDVDGVIPASRESVEEIERTMAAPVIDLLRRAKPGQTFRLAMYGMSPSSPEYKALTEAIDRGVAVRAVIYKSYNESAIAALKALRDQGKNVDLRIISSRVMHEKFGVVGDDCFNGSANWSSSSITKHTEDRFLFCNEPELADRFVEEFSRLWERGNAPT